MDSCAPILPDTPSSKCTTSIAKISVKALARKRWRQSSRDKFKTIVSPRLALATIDSPRTAKFRSMQLLDEVLRSERVVSPLKGQSRTKMTPESALTTLQELLMSSTGTERMLQMKPSELIDGLRRSCWVVHSNDSKVLSEPAEVQEHLRLEQVFRGVQSRLQQAKSDGETNRERLAKLRHENRRLPQEIARRREQLGTVFVGRTTRDESREQDSSATSKKDLVSCLKELEKRYELRRKACEELRVHISTYEISIVEQRRQADIIMTKVREEEAVFQLKSRQLKEASADIKNSSLPPVTGGRVAGTRSKRITSIQPNAAGGRQIITTPTEELDLDQTVALCYRRKAELMQELERVQALVRASTEEIFSIRTSCQGLQKRREESEKDKGRAEDEINKLHESHTPRPKWKEMSAVQAEEVASRERATSKNGQARLKRRNTLSKMLAKGVLQTGELLDDENEEEDSAKRVLSILQSEHGTIDKVNALATELARVRSMYEVEEMIQAEQAKLSHLVQEIETMRERIADVKARTVQLKEIMEKRDEEGDEATSSPTKILMLLERRMST